jgi:hypothetical protein
VAPPLGVLPESARKNFEEGLLVVARHDRDNDWSDAVCVSTAELFLAKGGDRSVAALYNAGLVQQRCHQDAKAEALYRAALDRDPSLPGWQSLCPRRDVRYCVSRGCSRRIGRGAPPSCPAMHARAPSGRA